MTTQTPAPEFYQQGMNSAEVVASILRYNASEARVFDISNNTVVVTRELLCKAADTISELSAAIEIIQSAARIALEDK